MSWWAFHVAMILVLPAWLKEEPAPEAKRWSLAQRCEMAQVILAHTRAPDPEAGKAVPIPRTECARKFAKTEKGIRAGFYVESEGADHPLFAPGESCDGMTLVSSTDPESGLAGEVLGYVRVWLVPRPKAGARVYDFHLSLDNLAIPSASPCGEDWGRLIGNSKGVWRTEERAAQWRLRRRRK